MRILRVLFALPAALLALSTSALAAGDAASIVPPEADARAIVGTVVIGIAGGLVLAILDGTESRRSQR